MSDMDYLGVLVTDPKPVRMPDGQVLEPPPQPKIKADLSGIAVGLWAGYLFVLFCPGRKGSKAMGERDLMQAYGGMMNLFSLV